MHLVRTGNTYRVATVSEKTDKITALSNPLSVSVRSDSRACKSLILSSFFCIQSMKLTYSSMHSQLTSLDGHARCPLLFTRLGWHEHLSPAACGGDRSVILGTRKKNKELKRSGWHVCDIRILVSWVEVYLYTHSECLSHPGIGVMR